MAENLVLRELKKHATRERLLDEAVRLFVERGFDGTSVDVVAAAAGVSRATAFTYFPKKEDFFLEWTARRRGELAERLAAHGDAGSLDAIVDAVRTLAAHYVGDPQAKAFVRCWLAAGGPLLPGASDSAGFFSGIVRAAQRAGRVRPGVDPATAGRLVLNAYLGTLYEWAARDRSDAWLRRELVGAVQVVVRGLAAPGQ